MTMSITKCLTTCNKLSVGHAILFFLLLIKQHDRQTKDTLFCIPEPEDTQLKPEIKP